MSNPMSGTTSLLARRLPKSRKRHAKFAILVAAAGAVLASHSAFAADTLETIWTNAGTDWGTSANWGAANGPPSSTVSAEFNSAFTNQPNLSSDSQTQGIWVTGAGQTGVAGLTTISGAHNLFLTGSATLDGIANAGILLDGAGNSSLTIDNTVTGVTTSFLATFSTSFLVNNTGTLTIAAPLTITSTTTLTLGSSVASGAGSIVISGAIQNTNGALTVNNAGGGTTSVTLSGNNSYTGATTLKSGTLKLNAGGTDTAVGASSALILGGGGTLSDTGTSSTTEQFSSTTLSSGFSTISTSGAIGHVLALGTIGTGRVAGSAVNFTPLSQADNAPGAIATTTPNSGTTGILGGYATINGTDWAVQLDPFGTIGAYTGYTTLTSSGGGAQASTNFTSSGNTLILNPITANSLKITDTSGTMALNGTMQLNSAANGGLLDAATSGSYTISGSTISVGGNSEFLINVNTPTSLIITSTLLTGNVGSLTKVGGGTLVLSGINTFTGGITLDSGMLVANTVATSLGNGTVSLNGGNLVLQDNTGLNFGRNVTVGGNATISSDVVSNGIAGATQTLGTLSIGGGFALNTAVGGNVGSGTAGITFSGNTTLTTGGATFSPAANTLLNLGSVTGAFNLIKTGSGALTIVNAGQPAIFLNAGTLNLNGNFGNSQVDATLTINGGTVDNTSGAALSGTALQWTQTNSNGMQINGNFGYSNPNGTANNSMTFSVGNGGVSPIVLNFFGSPGAGSDRTVTINGAGTLNFNGNPILNNADSARTLTVNNGSSNSSFGALNIANNYNLTGANSTFARNDIVNGSGNVILSGVIADGVSAGSALTYNGTGFFTLSNTNTFTGGVTLSSGTLNINKGGALGTTAGTFAIGGGTLDNTSGAAVTTSNYPITLNGNFAFTGGVGTLHDLNLGTGLVSTGASTPSRTITANSGTLAIGGIISNSAAGATTTQIIKAGNGALTLSGVNTFTGGVTLNAGKLNIGNAQALGTAAGTFAINGGIVDATGAITTLAYPETWGGNFVFAGTNALVLGGSAGTGAITLSTNVAVTTAASSLTVNGVIGENPSGQSLTKNGAGTMVLALQPTYTGGTTVNGGALIFSAAVPATGTITVNTGGIVSTGLATNAILSAINSSSTGAVGINVSNATAFDFSAIGANGLSLGATTAVTYSGTLTPFGQTYRFGGGTAQLTESVNLPNVNALPTNIVKVGTDALLLNSNPSTSITGGLTVNGGSVLLNGSASNLTAITIAAGSTLQIGSGSSAGSVPTGVTITDNGTLTFQRSDLDTQGTHFGTISGTGGVTHSRAVVLTLNAANTYTGTTNLNTGTISVNSAEGVGSGPLGNGGPITFTGGTLQYGASSSANDYSSRIVKSSSAITIDTNGQTVTYASPIAGSNTGGLTLNDTPGTGALVLSAANLYFGTTTITKGTLQLNNPLALRNSTVSVGIANGLTFGSAGTYTVAGLTGGSNELLPANVTLQVGNNAAGTSYTGVLSGSGSLATIFNGIQSLSTSEQYSGNTSVNGFNGTLKSTLATTGTPFGTGNINVVGGTLALVPSAVGAPSLTGATNSAATFAYGGGSILQLTRNSAASSLTFTVGDGTNAPITRIGNGTLAIKPSTTTTLGQPAASFGERFIVNGSGAALPTLTNNMVSASIAGLNTTVLGQFDFLTYDNTNGFKVATYTTNLTTTQSYATNANDLLESTPGAAQVETISQGAGNAYSLVINPAGAGGSTKINGTVNIGDGAHPAGVIFNAGIGGGTSPLINFGTSEGVVWVKESYGGSLGVGFAGTGGVTYTGDNGGPENLPASTFTGGVTLNLFTFNGNDTPPSFDTLFGDASNTITFNGAATNSNLSGTPFSTNRAITVTAAGATFGPDNHYFYYGGNMTVAGLINLTIGNPTTQTGGGTLTGNNTISSGGGLVFSNGGLPWRVASDANLGGSTSALYFSGGMIGVMGTSLTSFGSHPVTFISGVGIDVQNPGANFTVDRPLNMGNNTFTKYGPGAVTLTASNTYIGATLLFGGTVTVDATAGGALSAFATSPATNATAPTFSGGNLYLLGKTSGTTSTILGAVTVGQAGGTLTVDTHGANTYNVTLGTLAPVATPGATLNIVTTGGGTANITTTTSVAALNAGIISPRYVLNGSDWATITTAATGINNAISAYSGYTTVAAAATPSGTDANNSQLNSSSGTAGAVTTGASWTTNSLKITGGTSLTNTGNALALTTGGVLFTSASPYAITGGTISASATGYNGTTTDLIVQDFGAGTLTINSAITNTAGGLASTLTKAGSGTLVLAPTIGFNAYSGNTFINSGVLSVSADAQLGAGGSVYLDGGTLRFTGTSSFVMSSPRTINLGSTQGNANNDFGGGGTIDVTNGGTLTFTGAVEGGALTITTSDNSGGIVVLNNSAGAPQINDGVNIGNGATLRLGNSKNFNSISAGEITNYVTLGSSATFELAGNAVSIAGLASNSSTAVVGNAFGGTSVTARALTVSAGDNETFAGTLVDNATGGAGTGSLSIIKDGGGTWTLTNANSNYTGSTTIFNGGISVSTISNEGTAGNLGKGPAVNGTGATAPIQMGFGASPAALIYTGGGENTNRNINLAGLSGGATIDMSGTNTLEFSGNFNAVPSLATSLLGGANKTLTLQGNTLGIGQIDNAIVDSTGITGTTQGTGSGITSLLKQGTGKWILSGQNSYTGTTSVTNGLLTLTGTLAVQSNTTVGNPTTGSLTPTLGGGIGGANGGSLAALVGGSSFKFYSSNTSVGNVQGTLAILGPGSGSAGHLAPGNSVGTLTAGSLTLATGSVADYEFDGSTSTNDFTAVTNTLTLPASGTVGINVYAVGTTTAFTTPGTYNLFSYATLAGTDPATSITAINLTPGTFSFSNDAADHLVQLTIGVPEPTSLGLLGLGAVGLLARRRRRTA